MVIEFWSVHRATLRCGVVLGALALAACQSAPPPAQMAKTSLGTAPADLQLLCSNAAQLSTGADASTILPVSSSQIDANNYEVVLGIGAQRYRCFVNSDGVVKSVSPG